MLLSDFALKEIEPRHAAVIRAEVPMAELRDVFDRGFHAVMSAVQASGAQIIGPPFGFYPRMPSETVEVLVGFPVDRAIALAGDVEPFTLPGGTVLTGVHVGPYETMMETYDQLMAWVKREGIELGPAMWETYLTDPGEAPPSEWRTELYWPVV